MQILEKKTDLILSPENSWPQGGCAIVCHGGIAPLPLPPPRQDGTTGLISASRSGHKEVVRLLLEHKASVNAAKQVP